MNRLKALQDFGQSVWLDYLRRDLLTGGELNRLISEDGLRGMTSNPSIFEKAIGESALYDGALRDFQGQHDSDPLAIFEHLAVADIRQAADMLRPVHQATRGRDGYVSLEVSPYIASRTVDTIADARRLWRAVDRPNLMIKVPGTEAGVPAVRQLTSEGININITLLFARSAYKAVAEAFIEGLEAFAAAGGNVAEVTSVASFFVSRIDTAMDAAIAERLKQTSSSEDRRALEGLLGKVAIANAKLAYQDYKAMFGGPRWLEFARKRDGRGASQGDHHFHAPAVRQIHHDSGERRVVLNDQEHAVLARHKIAVIFDHHLLDHLHRYRIVGGRQNHVQRARCPVPAL